MLIWKLSKLEIRKDSWHLDRADQEIQLGNLHTWKNKACGLSLTQQRGDVKGVTTAVRRLKQLTEEVIPTISFWVEMSKEDRLCQSQLTNRCHSYQEQFDSSLRFRYVIDKAKSLILCKEKLHNTAWEKGPRMGSKLQVMPTCKTWTRFAFW